MNSHNADDQFFEKLAAGETGTGLRAPSRLKSRIYSALQQKQAQTGPLLSVSETKAEGRHLCVFEELVHIAPVEETLKCRNFCRVCHARAMAERWEDAPIFWPNCPYVKFQNR